jgi:hypothetical protein
VQTRRILKLTAALWGAFLVLTASAVAAPPVNTSPPTITGTPRVGETLTAQNGTWEGNPTAFTYQWQRCDANGANCANIAGATQRTYTVVNADAGETLRVRVTATNAEGSSTVASATTAVVSSSAAPRNTERPTISGTTRVGEQLTADPGSWTGSPDSFAFQWQRCDVDSAICVDVTGATGRTYALRLADLGFRLRVEATARSSRGQGTARSLLTTIVTPAAAITNRRPTLRIISVRFAGARVYARFRVCDDTRKNLTILQTDSRPGRLSYTRRFTTLIPPRPCGVYTRNWLPAPRFRGPGRYTLTLRARDTSRLTSLPARRTFVR